MKIASTSILVLLIFLSILSGVTKVALMPEDVEFFGRYGFSSPLLIAFGATQLIGGVLMPFRKTRFVGAAIVAVTFLISLGILLMDLPGDIANGRQHTREYCYCSGDTPAGDRNEAELERSVSRIVRPLLADSSHLIQPDFAHLNVR